MENSERVGVSAVIADSFARIFYRNAVNVGLPVITCETGWIDHRDALQVDLLEGVLTNRTQQRTVAFDPIAPAMMPILQDGGLKAHVKEHGALNLG